jgi:hypothetical protein
LRSEKEEKKMSSLNWESDETKAWMELAREKQLSYLDMFEGGEADCFNESSLDCLALKIGFALYGPSTEETDNYENIKSYKYDKVQSKEINKILAVLKGINKRDSLEVAFIFVICKQKDGESEYPVIRVESGTGKKAKFVDSVGRIYRDWKDYLRNNKITNSYYCYPSEGVYTYEGEKAKVEFGESPDRRTGKWLLRGVDTVTSGLGIGSAGIAVAALLVGPVAAPLAIGASIGAVYSGLYTAGRSVESLVDKKQHGESLLEAKSAYLGLATGIVGALSGGMLRGASSSVVLNIAGLTLSSASVGTRITHLIRDRKLSKRDLADFAVALFFFTNAVINLKTTAIVMSETRSIRPQFSHIRRAVTRSTLPVLLETRQQIVEKLNDFSAKFVRNAELAVLGACQNRAVAMNSEVIESKTDILDKLPEETEKREPNCSTMDGNNNRVKSPRPVFLETRLQIIAKTVKNPRVAAVSASPKVKRDTDSFEKLPKEVISLAQNNPLKNDNNKKLLPIHDDSDPAIKNKILQALADQISPNDYSLLFGTEFEIPHIFDHLDTETRDRLCEMFNNGVMRLSMEDLIETVIALSIKKKNSSPGNVYEIICEALKVTSLVASMSNSKEEIIRTGLIMLQIKKG